jgi:hypothetical protein
VRLVVQSSVLLSEEAVQGLVDPRQARAVEGVPPPLTRCAVMTVSTSSPW